MNNPRCHLQFIEALNSHTPIYIIKVAAALQQRKKIFRAVYTQHYCVIVPSLLNYLLFVARSL